MAFEPESLRKRLSLALSLDRSWDALCAHFAPEGIQMITYAYGPVGDHDVPIRERLVFVSNVHDEFMDGYHVNGFANDDIGVYFCSPRPGTTEPRMLFHHWAGEYMHDLDSRQMAVEEFTLGFFESGITYALPLVQNGIGGGVSIPLAGMTSREFWMLIKLNHTNIRKSIYLFHEHYQGIIAAANIVSPAGWNSEQAGRGERMLFSFGGTNFQLGSQQTKAVQTLIEQHRRGNEWIRGRVLLDAAGSKCLKVVDLFKSQANWRQLIISDGKGWYRINPDFCPDDT